MIDINQIIKDYSALECACDNTYNVISLPRMVHKLGTSKEHYPLFFVLTNDGRDKIPNTVMQLLSVEYDMSCTVNEEDKQSFSDYFAIISLRSPDEHLQFYFIEIFLMMLIRLDRLPSKKELSIEVERLATIFSALISAPRKEIQGLWAELLVIERSKDPITLINAWHSLPSSKYDFNSGRDKIEVKSTSSEERMHRFSLDQLNPSPSSRLLIGSIIVRESGQDIQGLSVKGLYDKICERISSVDAQIKIYTIIAETLGNNIDKFNSVYFDYVTAVDSMAFYNYENVPKIFKGNVPPNVSGVVFTSNLSGIEEISSPFSSLNALDSQLFNAL